MRGLSKALIGAALVSGFAIGTCFASSSPYTFKLVTTIQLQGPKGHGDIAEYDPTNGMVYVSMAKDGFDIVDTKTNKVVAYISGNLPSPNGEDYDANYVYWAVAGDKVNQLVVVDKKTWKVVDRVNTKGTSPDGVQVDRTSDTVYVTSDDNNWIEKYKGGAHPTFEAKWSLYPDKPKSGPDVGTLVPSLHAIFQPDDAFAEKVDTNTGKVVKSVDEQLKLTKHGGTKASKYDAAHNRLWMGTTDDEVLVIDPSTLATIAKVPDHGGIDDVAFDPKLGIVYAFGGNGRMGFDAFDAKTMKPIAFVWTHVGQTHTGTVDTANDEVYAFGGVGGELFVYKPVKAQSAMK